MIAEAIEMHLEMMHRSRRADSTARRRRYEFAVDSESAEELCTWVEVETPQLAIS